MDPIAGFMLTLWAVTLTVCLMVAIWLRRDRSR